MMLEEWESFGHSDLHAGFVLGFSEARAFAKEEQSDTVAIRVITDVRKVSGDDLLVFVPIAFKEDALCESPSPAN
jgi:hypothetical protein